MDLYQRQQFDFLLQTAVQRLAERLQERHGSCEAALRMLEPSEPRGEVTEFVKAIFLDFILDNVDGACFVLRSLARTRLEQPVTLNAKQTIDDALTSLARREFQTLLVAKTREMLQQYAGYQPVTSVMNSKVEMEAP